MDMGCHSIAYCRWVFGNAPVESVYADAANFVHQARTRGDDHAIVNLRFAPTEKHPRGGLGIAENSWARIGGFDNRAEIYGSQGLTVADMGRGGSLHTFSAQGYAYAGEKAPWTRGWTWTGFEEAWSYGFPQEIAHFVDCVEHGHAADAHRRRRPRGPGDHLRRLPLRPHRPAPVTADHRHEAAAGRLLAQRLERRRQYTNAKAPASQRRSHLESRLSPRTDPSSNQRCPRTISTVPPTGVEDHVYDSALHALHPPKLATKHAPDGTQLSGQTNSYVRAR